MAKEAGIKKETIMLDPGIGFAKDLDQKFRAYEPSGVIKSVGMYQFFLEHLEIHDRFNAGSSIRSESRRNCGNNGQWIYERMQIFSGFTMLKKICVR